MKFGLFINTGEFPGQSHDQVLAAALAYAEAAERLNLHDVWISEHHFIKFGVCSSALTMAGFLLGRTQRLRVGTAVTLAPLYHPVQLAEQVALLDQLSGGRLDFGIGRGGYLKDYEVFGIDTERWTQEVEGTLDVLLAAWTQETAASDNRFFPFPDTPVYPRPATHPHPPVFVASSTPATVERAARDGLPLALYWGYDDDTRAKVIATYTEAAERHGRDPHAVEHMVSILAHVTDDETVARDELLRNLTYSFHTGDHPHVPQGGNRHTGPDGKPVDRDALATRTIAAAAIGPPERCAEIIAATIDRTGARRLTFMVEAIAGPPRVIENIERLTNEVLPLVERHTTVAQPVA